MLTVIKRYNVDSIGLMTIAGTETFSHDAMGNPTSYGSKTLTWNGKQLTRYYYHPNKNELYDYTYAYDENGLRTQKVLNRVTTSYYYNGSVLMGMVTGNSITQTFSYDASGNVVSVNYNGTEYYYLRNAQNDIVKVIDGNGATVVEYKYDSWGKPISTTGSLSATLGANQPFRYRGYVYDTETGWYYLQSRYYDPSIARFISADVYLSTGQGVLGHNSYAYCLNNPVNMSDISGCLPNPMHRPVMVNDGGGSILISLDSSLILGGGTELNKDVPPDHPNFKPPKRGNKKVKNPNGKGVGWLDNYGNVWVPTPDMHGGPGWTVQYPNGGHYHAYPGGHVRYAVMQYTTVEPELHVYIIGALMLLLLMGDDFFGIVADDTLIPVVGAAMLPVTITEYYCEDCGESWR